MQLKMQRILFALISSLFLAATAHAQPAVHKASAPSDLHALSMSIGGRTLATPVSSEAAFGGQDYTYQWPGIYFRASFQGAQVYLRVVKGDQILHIVADGRPVGTLAKPAPGVYEVEGLSQAKHEITVLVATESQSAPDTFGGFAVPASEKTLPPPHHPRQVEFIGDSHTVGYGNLSTTHTCTRDEVWARTDDTRAFGAVTAAHYDADYQVNAISGRGIVRNYDGFQADTLPQAYPYILFDKKQQYSDPSWNPQVLVIALGTNDFTTPLHSGERWKARNDLHADYEATYLQFLEKLRARNPKALIIVWATDLVQGEIAAEAQKVVQTMNQQGDQRITFLLVSGLSFGACDFHPSTSDDEAIAGKLIHVIDSERVWQK